MPLLNIKRLLAITSLFTSLGINAQHIADLPSLYGNMVPGPSKPLNTLANTAVILPDTRAQDWPGIRAGILKRLMTAIGTGPVELTPTINKFTETGRYQNYGLTHIKYRYHVVDSIWNEAVVILPEKFQANGQSSAILTIHGTNGKAGKAGALGEPGTNRAYAAELAKKGYVTFAPDLFGYGNTIDSISEEKLVNELLKKYPGWSYRGIKLLGLIRALDVLDQLPFVKKGGYGSIGNSLGGGMALFHAAIDQRIKVSVPSTGVSPAATNIYRLMKSGANEEPAKWKKIQADGKPPYDVHEIIALCAPRAMLFLDDFNDPYNPDVAASFNAIYQAMQVYQLLGLPAHISVLIHGDGHDTITDIRDYAYKWFDRYLLKKSGVPVK